MKRLLLMFAMTLILLGTLSESVSSLNRPWREGDDNGTSNTTGDHPWGGDGSTTGTGTVSPSTNSFVAPSTGFGPLDLVLRLYFYKFSPHNTSGRFNRNRPTSQPTVTTPVDNTSTTNSGTVTTSNE